MATARKTTPNLERMARRGIRFEQARGHGTLDPAISRKHVYRIVAAPDGVGKNRPLDGTHPTVAEFLAARGYLTAGFVANTYFCNSWYGLGRGFTHYEDFYDEDLVVSVTETLRSSYWAGLVRLRESSPWRRAGPRTPPRSTTIF